MDLYRVSTGGTSIFFFVLSLGQQVPAGQLNKENDVIWSSEMIGNIEMK